MNGRIAVTAVALLALLGASLLWPRVPTGGATALPESPPIKASTTASEPDILGHGSREFVGTLAVQAPVDSAANSSGERRTRITIAVEDEFGVPVTSAQVLESALHEHFVIAQVDLNGRAQLSFVPRGELRYLTVVSTYHASAYLDVPDDADATYSLTLGRRGHVSGRVVLMGDAIPVSNVRVMAITPAEAHEATGHPRETTRLEATRTSISNAVGDFRIDDLREGREYELRILSSQYGTLIGDRGLRFRATREDLIVRIVPLVGCIVRFACRSQDDLQGGGRVPLWRTMSSPGLMSVPGTFGRSWAGPGRIYTPGTDEIDAILGVGSREIPIPARVRFVANVLGFERIDTDLLLFPLDGGPLRVQEIELIPVSDEFGSLQVQLHGEPAELLGTRNFRASLLLREGSGTEPIRVVASVDPATTSCVLDKIPPGSYEWRLESAAGMCGFPETGWGSLSILPGQITPIVIDLSSHGYLKLESFDSGGEPAFSIVILSDRHVVDHRSMSTWIKPVPCIHGNALVGPLPAGEYNIAVESNSLLPESGYIVDVLPGVVHHEVILISNED